MGEDRRAATHDVWPARGHDAARIVKLYGVMQIPQAFLVDGATGRIIAQGGEIEGRHLLPAVRNALAARSH